MTEMDGLVFDGVTVEAISGASMEIPDQPMMTWSEFRSFANRTAQRTLTDWGDPDGFVVAFVLRQPDGDEIVA